MKPIITAILLLLATQAQALDFYAEIGIGVTGSGWNTLEGEATDTANRRAANQPEPAAIGPVTEEYKFSSPLGKFVIGVEAQDGWAVEFEHISGLMIEEKGNGLNALWFMKRIRF